MLPLRATCAIENQLKESNEEKDKNVTCSRMLNAASTTSLDPAGIPADLYRTFRVATSPLVVLNKRHLALTRHGQLP